MISWTSRSSCGRSAFALVSFAPDLVRLLLYWREFKAQAGELGLVLAVLLLLLLLRVRPRPLRVLAMVAAPTT